MSISTDAIAAAADRQDSEDIATNHADTAPARDYAAAHQTCLALSRWCGGLSLAESTAASPTAQARWHAQRQDEFTSWLAAGGFAQGESLSDAQLKTAALRRCSQPHVGTIYEESKFSLLRINDAV